MHQHINDQNQENEFILNFEKRFITIPKNIPESFQIPIDQANLTKNLIEEIQKQNNITSPKDILEQSRAQVVNSRSVKSLSASQPQGESHLNNSNISKLKAKKQVAEQILKNRFSQYKQKLSQSITKLESICQEHFGGVQNVNRELAKHQLNQSQLALYYAKMLPKNSEIFRKNTIDKKKSSSSITKLPKLRSQSQKNILFFNTNKDKKAKKQSKLNKWYIEPQKRFSTKKEKTKYDWKTEEGLKNVIRTQQLKVKSKQIQSLIKQVKQKFHRQPIFCKYIKIS